MLKKQIFNSDRKGFTLLEVIIYVAILSFLIVGVIDIAILVKQSQSKFIANRRVAQDEALALNNIDFLVRNSDGFVTDNTGKACEDFDGTQGYNTYYMALYFNTTSAATVLPYECRGTFSATTTAVKIYWKDTTSRALWMDCYRGFINGNSTNCTAIQSYGDASFLMTSAKNSVLYNGGLTFATSTAYGLTALTTTLTMGLPNYGGTNYYSASTTASTTSAFRVKIANPPAPTEVVCGDSSRGSGEVCDSSLSSACALNGNYYKGNYSEDGSTCSGKAACKNDCSACLSTVSCDGSSCGGYSSGGKCWYLGALGQSCTTVCSGHGSCVAGSSWDDISCSVLQALGANCAGGCEIGGLRATPNWDDASYCQWSSTIGETCASSNAALRRACVCTS